MAREKYENPSEDEKEKKHQYGHEWYKNLLEDEYGIQDIKPSWI